MTPTMIPGRVEYNDRAPGGEELNLRVDIELTDLGNPLATNDVSIVTGQDFDQVRSMLQADRAANETLVDQLPTAAQFQAATPDPVDFPVNVQIDIARANLLALGVDEASIVQSFPSDFSVGDERDMRIDLNSRTSTTGTSPGCESMSHLIASYSSLTACRVE